MVSDRKILFAVLSVVAIFLVSVCMGQESDTGSILGPFQEVAPSRSVSFPQVGEVTGQDVYVRAGPGTVWYSCGKLNAPARVRVVGEKHIWLEIIPPAGSFSWISKNYVKPDAGNPEIGIVTADSVNVWAGSEDVPPTHSTRQQTKLNKGETVKLLGAEEEEYYKIAPPRGAHLWISNKYVKYVGPVSEPKAVDLLPKPEPEPKTEDEPKPAPGPGKPGLEAKMLKKCSDLGKQMAAELAKPLDEQNYEGIKEALEAIINNPEAGKAQRYGQHQLERIAGFELARQVCEEVKRHDAQLAKLREEIRDRLARKLEEISEARKYIIMGEFRPSEIYTDETSQKRYMIVDETGKIVCYAVPDQSAARIDVDKLMYCKVGLEGKMLDDLYNTVRVVKFSNIEELASEADE